MAYVMEKNRVIYEDGGKELGQVVFPAVNIGVATSSIPTTGQTLPFVSAGGTSLFIFLCASGILLNISKNMEET